ALAGRERLAAPERDGHDDALRHAVALAERQRVAGLPRPRIGRHGRAPGTERGAHPAAGPDALRRGGHAADARREPAGDVRALRPAPPRRDADPRREPESRRGGDEDGRLADAVSGCVRLAGGGRHEGALNRSAPPQTKKAPPGGGAFFVAARASPDRAARPSRQDAYCAAALSV